MIHPGPEQIRERLDFPSLIDAIRLIFQMDIWTPARHHHQLAGQGVLLLMPSWKTSSYGGVKIVTIMEDNASRGLPTVQGTYLLMNARTGEPLATFDARTLTLLRTAAASALASSLLSRPDSDSLLMIGAGALAFPLVQAHSQVRRIRHIRLWNRSQNRTHDLARRLAVATEATIEVVDNLDNAISRSDIISCATMSRDPLVKHSAVAEGTHVDLVGAYTPTMRESDSALIENAHVFVDSRDGATREAGDLTVPISEGRFSANSIVADFKDMCRPDWDWKRDTADVTVFKSVGHAAEDLAAAVLAYERGSE